ncbi:hypothetical protein K438DRAFT_1988535 [Mycena galopus ATCC 62051]|nr:hypothetical protein K438DRAFT_1988535 [Mycena galopus ATCC 62051]
MVLKMLVAAYAHFPTQYTAHVVTTVVVLLLTHRLSQGRKTTRDRELHGRVVLLSGAFTPLGLTLLESLAQRGAHIVALTPHPVASEGVATYIDLVRTTTSNENVYAEECDLRDPGAIKAFVAKFVSPPSLPTAQPPRLDALVCAHEYAGVGALGVFASSGEGGEAEREREQTERDESALATFLLVTLLLPAMLTAPVERDIRIVNVVNRFYAAAAPRLVVDKAYEFVLPTSSASSIPKKPSASPSPLLPEATRALRTVLFTRHLQRILDALPSAQVPDPAAGPSAQKSNIVAVSVSPGFGAETVAPLFGVGWFGRFLYLLLTPLLLLLTKSARASAQSVLHVLFLPTVGKISKTKPKPKTSDAAADPLAEPEEALKAGALYAECAVVRLGVPSSPGSRPGSGSTPSSTAPATSGKGKGKEREEGDADAGGPQVQDDADLGGERAGRAVWEAYEAGLKAWEARSASKPEGRGLRLN